MESLFEIRERFLNRIEPVLSYAQAAEDTRAAQAAVEFLGLFSQPEYRLFNAADFLRSRKEQFAQPQWELTIESIREAYVGAPELMLHCLLTLLKAIELSPASVLHIEVFEEEDRGEFAPVIGIGFEGPGAVPKMVALEGFFQFSMAEFNDCWTLATQGGRIDEGPNGLLLKLSGMRMPPEPLPEAFELLLKLGPAPDQEALKEALAYLDGEKRFEPGDLAALFKEVLGYREALLAQHAILLETAFREDLPPIRIYRKRMWVFFMSLLDYALWALPENSEIQLMAEYEAEEREVVFLIDLKAKGGALRAGFHAASLRRAIQDHQGQLELEEDTQEATLSVSLPDPVGADLDAWLPGWEGFDGQSRQLLRLLKSGGACPPEDFVLGGILEKALEGWLIPKLKAPAAVNIAHELPLLNKGLTGSEEQRLKKALEQIIRGKVKKEICAPAYAGEILWAFRKDARSKGALGLLALSEEDLEALCTGLLEKPVDALGCLKLVAKVLAAE